MVHSTPNLLVGGEDQFHWGMRLLRVGQKLLCHGDNLRNPGLVIRPQQSGPIGDDQILPHISL